jgi:ornithine cyclodeaminase/alanine dehydrogenase-like protein (mu-crystallin family)
LRNVGDRAYARRLAEARTHVDLVGAFKAHMRETDDAVMKRADLIVVDDRVARWRKAAMWCRRSRAAPLT